MKWLSDTAVLILFVLLLLLGRGQAVWDGVLASLVAVSPNSVVSLPPALTTRGDCQVAHLVGRDLLLHEQAEAALPYLETAVVCNTNRWAWFDLGRAQYALGQDEAAAQSWQKADAYDHVVRLAAVAKADGDVAAEQAAWALAALVAPQAGQPFVQMGRLVVNENPEQAKQLYEQAIALDADYAPAYQGLGDLYLRQLQSPEQALPYFEQAHQFAPDNIEYLVIVARQTAGTDPVGALSYWQELVEIRPENAEFQQGIARAYEAANCPAEAMAAYQQLLALQPGSEMRAEAESRLAELTAVPRVDCGVRGD